MSNRKPSSIDESYLNLRLCIGILGIGLPFILRIGSAFFPPDPYSVSAYYYSAMRNVLVASLCVLGTFLLTYRGYDKLDSWITNVSGAATIGVALFPTSNPGFRPAWVGHVHPFVAGIALTGQALMALQFTQNAPRAGTRWSADVKRMLRALIFRYARPVHDEHGRKLTRNRIYSACAWLIIVGVVLAFVQNFFPASVKAGTQWMFWFESLSIAAFGVAWLVKGESLLRDASAQARTVPVAAGADRAAPSVLSHPPELPAAPPGVPVALETEQAPLGDRSRGDLLTWHSSLSRGELSRRKPRWPRRAIWVQSDDARVAAAAR